ncbi:MAG: hypothetical protein ACOYJY_06075 [Acutalibacteraceae bacterium]|jgi:hypothetical protein
MKKWLSLTLACLLLGCMITSVAAESLEPASNVIEVVISETTEYLEDGSSITITVTEERPLVPSGASVNGVSKKSGSKTYTKKNLGGDVLWKFKVNGTFSVNMGVSAICISASHSSTIVNTDWSCTSASSAPSANKAVGNAAFVCTIWGIPVETVPCSVTLTCDKNGMLT